MSVRAKLYVSEITRGAGSPDAVKVKFAAVTRGEENKQWAEATPMANFEMTIQNPEAAAIFYTGQEFYVDFNQVPREEMVGKDQNPFLSNLTLADPHDYEPTDYERENGDRYGNGRCVRCNCKKPSHDEPLRSKLISTMGIPVSVA